MNLLELFKTCNSSGWTTAGKNVQFKVIDRVLYFQCSHGKSDWRYNFTAWKEVYSDSDIKFVAHKGFNELWHSVKSEIEKLEFDSICGYSQGGALAVYAHENYFHRLGKQPETITFGCPPGIFMPSRELKDRCSAITNVHNPRDVVYLAPHVIGYSHVGKGLKLSGKAKRPDVGLLYWLSGHSPEEYIQRLS